MEKNCKHCSKDVGKNGVGMNLQGEYEKEEWYANNNGEICFGCWFLKELCPDGTIEIGSDGKPFIKSPGSGHAFSF